LFGCLKFYPPLSLVSRNCLRHCSLPFFDEWAIIQLDNL